MKIFMRFLIVALGICMGAMATAGTCVGPAPCSDDPPVAVPDELCIAGICRPITYLKQFVPGATTPEPGYFILAFSSVGGYPVVGWYGPCLPGWECPAIYTGAYQDLFINAARVERVMRFDAAD